MLDALGDIGDFIGGIAVIASLIYVALQTRQNTTGLLVASRKGLVSSFPQHERMHFLKSAVERKSGASA